MDNTLEALVSVLGETGVITAPDVIESYVVDQRDLFRGTTPAVLRPATTEQVAAVVRVVSAAGFGLVPQGGNTGYCGGATPDSSGRQFLLSLERMNRVRSVDPHGFAMAVDAGIVLADAQKAAAEAGLVLPLSLGSEGSCRIGGNIATNAGGISVLRYGMTRDLLLGIEAVLPDGSILSDMTRLRKNNTGYDVKQCFVGSDGTLGIITGAVLKLFPAPVQHATAWVKLAAGVELAGILAFLRRETCDLLSAFEFITPTALELVERLGHGARSPGTGTGGALIVELSASSMSVPLADLLLAAVGALAEDGRAEDALLASSERQRQDIWKLRESIPEGEKLAGGSVKHDISVPISAVSAFIARGEEIVRRFDPSLRLSIYGHVGDGNIHYNVLVPAGADRLVFSAAVEADLSRRLYDLARSLDGTFSAEHGVGRLKRHLLEAYNDPVRVDLMRRIKTAFDPADVLNAGAVVSPFPRL
ncbi:FAD-binding oxidoreductase [Pseudochelatococcus sp. B33]